MSGTGIRQISHRFMSQTSLLLLSLVLQIFRFSTSLSQFSHQKTILLHYYTVSQSKVQCSTEIIFHLILIMVMRSCHVMSCYVTLPTLVRDVGDNLIKSSGDLMKRSVSSMHLMH